MPVTATTAPARAAVNTFSTTNIEIESSGLTVHVDAKPAAGAVVAGAALRVTTNAAQRITYGSDGMPTVNATPITISGIMATILTTFVSTAGNAATRLAAVDSVLQSNGIIPA